MKRIFTLFAVISLLSINAAFSQAPCNTPMPELAFRKSLDDLSRTQNEQQMNVKAKMILRNNCLSSAQIREIAVLFYDDYSRLEFAKNAYPKTVDKINYYDVYDAFAYFSTVFRLHDYVISFDLANTPPPVEAEPTPTRLQYPNYNYPNALRYSGKTFCNSPTSDMEFEQLAMNVSQQNNDPGRITVATQLAQKYCLTAAHIMKLTSLLSTEKARLNFLMNVYGFVFDAGNYEFCEQTLSPGPAKEQFKAFVAQNSAPVEVTPIPCGVEPAEFEQIMESIKKQSFNNTQVTLAKQVIKSKECLTAKQIKELVGIFSFESSKLDIAKYAFDYCLDKSNYYMVNDAFGFSSSIDELNRYIQSRN